VREDDDHALMARQNGRDLVGCNGNGGLPHFSSSFTLAGRWPPIDRRKCGEPSRLLLF
jgi:hypothetical protein